MVAQSSIGPEVFGPFGKMFEAYCTGLASLTQQGFRPQPLDPNVFSSQVTGPAKALARMQLEALGFANRRAQAYIEIPSRLARCRTAQDVVNSQMTFWRTAFEQYGESSRRMTEIWMQAFVAPGAFTVQSERDYIAFPSARDGNGQGGAPSSTHEKHRRVA